MKNFRSSKKSQQGFSTLEIIIALAVLTMSASAAIVVAFGNQSIFTDTQTNQEALYKAQLELENARALSRQDFNAVNSIAQTSDDIYQKETVVVDIPPCVKKVSSQLTWSAGQNRPQQVRLSTKLSSPSEAFKLGGDCSDNEPEDSWRDPDTCTTADLNPSGNEGSDIDVIKRSGNRYVLMSSKASSIEKPDFWVIDVTNLQCNPSVAPSVLGSVDTGPGLNALDAEGDYAFVANDNDTHQLQVIDISDPTDPHSIAERTLPLVTGSCPHTCPGGRSIFYYDHKVYVGTHRLVGATKHEFHIYDVSDPTNPIWLGSKKLDHNVNDIVVRDHRAYLATSADTKEVIVLDVSDPGSITEIGTFNAGNSAAGDEDGTALYLAGNKLYLGRERTPGSEPDLYVLDVTNPNPSFVGSKRLGLNPNTEVSGMVVSVNLLFIATSDSNAGFQVWDVSDLSNIVNRSTLNYSEKATGIDYMDNYVFVSNESNDALRVIYDNPN